jgi:hypothetical protein
MKKLEFIHNFIEITFDSINDIFKANDKKYFSYLKSNSFTGETYSALTETILQTYNEIQPAFLGWTTGSTVNISKFIGYVKKHELYEYDSEEMDNKEFHDTFNVINLELARKKMSHSIWNTSNKISQEANILLSPKFNRPLPKDMQ